MTAMLIPIFMSMLKRLVTEQFFEEIFLHAADKIVKSTNNDLDDKIVESVRKALGK